MEDTENKALCEPETKLYTQKDFDEYKAKLEQEIKSQAQKANMNELELAQTELAELKQKYQQKEDECLLAKQKEETSKLLIEANLDISMLDVVLVEKDMEKTKARISALKDFAKSIKQGVLQGGINTPVPLTSGAKSEYDAFVEGFDTSIL